MTEKATVIIATIWFVANILLTLLGFWLCFLFITGPRPNEIGWSSFTFSFVRLEFILGITFGSYIFLNKWLEKKEKEFYNMPTHKEIAHHVENKVKHMVLNFKPTFWCFHKWTSWLDMVVEEENHKFKYCKKCGKTKVE